MPPLFSRRASQVRFIGDQNPFRESSAGVQFFGVSTLNPEIYTIQRGDTIGRGDAIQRGGARMLGCGRVSAGMLRSLGVPSLGILASDPAGVSSSSRAWPSAREFVERARGGALDQEGMVCCIVCI